MPPKITLAVTQGKLTGKQFVFDERTSCIIGRARDCEPKLPNDQDHRSISRHHCLLDINPPDLRIRDFGSLNGTWVNGKKIGQRKQGQSVAAAAQETFPEHDLKHGDEIKLAGTVFRVGIQLHVVCGTCAAELPEDQQAAAPGVHRCASCRQKATPAQAPAPPARKEKVCGTCGKDVAGEFGEHRSGEYVCRSCRNDPFAILNRLLNLARTGKQELRAIQGYTIVKEIGRGGMGAVYLARHERTGEPVALKVMLPEVAADERARTRFLRETEVTKALHHRNVVQLRDSGCSNGTFFFTLEFCDGGSVDRLMKPAGRTLSIPEAGDIVLQALAGLEYAHQAEIPYVRLEDGTTGRGKGLVHRDLKPANLLLCGAGQSRIAKVADFGLAKAFDAAGLSGQTRTGTSSGTPVFMSRPQAIHFKYAQPDVDVWAMAASLYTMLTGRFVRDFQRGQDPWLTVLQSDAVPIRRRNGALPKKLAEVIDHALVEEPAIGFPSAAEFKRALEKVL